MNNAVHANTEEAARGIVPGRLVRISGESTRVGAPGTLDHGQPQVELIKHNDVLQAIDVLCPCGKRIRLRCIYAESPKQ